MNFFQHQDDARRKTRLLSLLLACAVLTLIIITTLFLAAFLFYFDHYGGGLSTSAYQQQSYGQLLLSLLQSKAILWLSLAVVLVIASGSLFKFIELRRGGSYVAEALGGQLLLHEQADNKQKQLLNVVEEMALASGVAVPRVYLLHEPSINAFAAGFNNSNAVIGITQGCIEALNRDQLQAVIAHEFSHIQHGDMKLNMRIVAVLHGIMMIGLVGELLLHSSSHRRHSSYSYSSSRNHSDNKLMPLGLGLVALGWGGSFFGGLIKSAVSRQREYLADASAVQFTRNPLGIAGALYQIQTHSGSSLLKENKASEFSHFYFANGVSNWSNKLFASHPPIDDRIERVFPAGIGMLEQELDKQKRKERKSQDTDKKDDTNNSAVSTEHIIGAAIGSAVGNSMQSQTTQTSTLNTQVNKIKAHENNSGEENTSSKSSSTGTQDNIDKPNDLSAFVGETPEISLAASHELISQLPKALYQACHNAFEARALCYLLLIHKSGEQREQQLQQLKQRAHPRTFQTLNKLLPLQTELSPYQYLPLLQLCLPALQNQSAKQLEVFFNNCKSLIQADRKVDLYEWCFYCIIHNALGAQNKHNSNQSLDKLHNEISGLLALVAHLNPKPELAYQKGISTLWPEKQAAKAKQPELKILKNLCLKLPQLKPLQKPLLLKALHAAMLTDGKLSSDEYTLLRTFGIILDCPLPMHTE
ncbi:M48 family metallopeptidase [Agaribacterium sp. ZY112]|uniref:M48 family metallopeptidase n=1 Tax=Agaribacterium sp. ZY112 TaxID=3233574 RepID=UPI0035258C34